MTPTAISLKTAATAAVVTRADAKAHARVEHDDEDALFDGYIAAAVGWIGDRTGRTIAPCTWTASFAGFPAGRVLDLPRPPLISVAAVTYLDTAGTSQTLSSSLYTLVQADTGGALVRTAASSWPATFDDPQAVSVEFLAGYSTVPPAIWSAAQLVVGHLYRNREAATADALKETPLAVEALLAPFRTYGWV